MRVSKLFQARLACAIVELEKLNVTEKERTPRPIFHLFWFLGIPVRPVQYLSKTAHFLIFFSLFFVVCSCCFSLMLMIKGQGPGVMTVADAFPFAIFVAFVQALIISLVSVLSLKPKSIRKQTTPWEKLVESNF